MRYATAVLPFKTRRLADGALLAVSTTGDHTFLSDDELAALKNSPEALSLERLAELRARFFVETLGHSGASHRLAASRIAAKRETLTSGPSLHIIVPTLQCAHSCKYCQVSRSLDDVGHLMSDADLEAACTTIFESPSPNLTIEFQGGDPLLRFDLVRRAVLRIEELNESAGRKLRFVVASTLHQLDEEMCGFFQAHKVYLSTSIDGPAALHNKNRPIPSRDAYERTLRGIELARKHMGHGAVAALTTTTRESLSQPEAIVDEYVSLGFADVFLRPLSFYGFAKRNQAHLAYTLEEFADFYRRGLERLLHWNREGVPIREVYASVVLNKMLSTFDGGYVDLQSPTGAGTSVVVYNYDGFVYPSDEARMLAETGDHSLRLGRIGMPLAKLLASPVQQALVDASRTEQMPGCANCAYSLHCAPNPVDALAQYGSLWAPPTTTDHCRRHLSLFDAMYERLRTADDWTLDLFHRWAEPVAPEVV